MVTMICCCFIRLWVILVILTSLTLTGRLLLIYLAHITGVYFMVIIRV